MSTNNDDGRLIINGRDRTSEITNYLSTKLDTVPFLNWMSWTFNPGGEGNFVSAMQDIPKSEELSKISKTFSGVIDGYITANDDSISSNVKYLYISAKELLETSAFKLHNNETLGSVKADMTKPMLELGNKIDGLLDSNDKTNLKLIFSRIDTIHKLSLTKASGYRDEFSTKSTISNLYNSLPDLSWLRKAIGSLFSSATQPQVGTHNSSFFSNIPDTVTSATSYVTSTTSSLIDSVAKEAKRTLNPGKSDIEMAFEGLKDPRQNDIASRAVLADKLIDSRENGTWYDFCVKHEEFRAKYSCEENDIDGLSDVECDSSAQKAMHRLVIHIDILQQKIMKFPQFYPTNALKGINEIRTNLALVIMPPEGQSLKVTGENKTYLSNIETNINNLGTTLSNQKEECGSKKKATSIMEKLGTLSEAKPSANIIAQQTRGIENATSFRDNHWDGKSLLGCYQQATSSKSW